MAGLTEIRKHTLGYVPLAPGTWRAVQFSGKPGEPDYRIKVSCPMCGTEAGLDEHEIDGDGVVSPSVECPALGCQFHEHIVLEEWADD